MNEEEYIHYVNNKVREGKFNRPIKVVDTKNKPTVNSGKAQGVASHINFKKYDRISLWKGLARNETQKKAREEQLSKKYGRDVKILDRKQILRHELWHVVEPYASEKKIKMWEHKPLPNRLPVKRRY